MIVNNSLAAAIGVRWLITKDGDPRVSDLYKRHYSCHLYRDRRRSQPGYRNRHLVFGPGEKLVLLSADCRAVLGWRVFIDASGQAGINCAFFRNEGAFDGLVKSSELILDAEALAFAKWGERRLYTYVNAAAVASSNPGYCFKVAGWRRCGETKSGLLILEKFPTGGNRYNGG